LINKVEICGVNTSKLHIASNEEKQELLIKIKNGDTDRLLTGVPMIMC